MKYSQYLSEFEKQSGKKASKFLVQFAKAMDQATEEFERRGREHAVYREPCPKAAIMTWALHEVGADLGELVGEEMYDSYMRGYRKGGTA